MTAFSPEETNALNSLLEQLRTWPRHRTIDVLLASWSRHVTDVEAGEAEYDELSNDLFTREILLRLEEACDSDLRKKLQAALAPVDDRFRACTYEWPEPLYDQESTHWFNFRMPKTFTPEDSMFNLILKRAKEKK